MVYTIGYTGFNIESFINILKKYNISCVIDVRSSPFSRRYPSYNQADIKAELVKHNILYRNYIDEFGARQTNPQFLTNGYVDFKKFRKSAQFLSGVDKLRKGIELQYTFCLLCAEVDPMTCHRSILLSKGLVDLNIKVSHILRNGELETQSQLENRLVELYFPNRNQVSLFETPKTYAQMLDEAYINANIKIGFYSEKE